MQLFPFVGDVVLRQDTSNSLIASIDFHNCIKVSIELAKDGS